MTGVPDHTVRLASPTDLIAIVPYLLGFHPTLSLVVTVLDTEGQTVGGVLRFDLPNDSADAPRLAGRLVDILTRNAARQVLLLGYGPGALVTPIMDAATDALEGAGIEIRDALRTDEGRYWSYTCTDLACCPPEGTPYEIVSSHAAVSAVVAGFVARPNRAALAATLAPVCGPDRDRVNAATRNVCAHARTLMSGQNRHGWYREGIDHVVAALDRVKAGEELDADAVAWLGVRLTAILVRDAAMTFLGRYDDETHIRLWTEVTRRVEPAFAAAPAALLAFAALRTGDGPLARVAVERALSVDPGYRLASMIGFALDHGLPPSVTSGMDCAEMADEIRARAEQYPEGARPVLPEGW
ncbi:DUF4192 domain-containing protein [Planotetraspora kaengkrachanensis]|uniref:DUF4192 domain-containing protein n=1 Tax=Planotetraspora kaengkrachanensis TaxID=575193 RepID=A0A8J3PTI7_9ACTN|nr:DUF4192 domain-containing protein [Planotetraspora kaengkrachanensis]GIG79976.1 hypothetical protein Pka01_31030 [Planotetraspora kaengkrachanensis]